MTIPRTKLLNLRQKYSDLRNTAEATSHTFRSVNWTEKALTRVDCYETFIEAIDDILNSDQPVFMAGERCRGCKSQPAKETHPCPYMSEIGDDDTPCNCCDDCTYTCNMEI